MIRNIIWSPASEKDFEIILEYLQNKWNKRVISKFINKLDDNIRLIAEDPKIFPVINKELQIRKLVITKHNTIYYREIEDNIEIVRLFDSRQQPHKFNI